MIIKLQIQNSTYSSEDWVSCIDLLNKQKLMLSDYIHLHKHFKIVSNMIKYYRYLLVFFVLWSITFSY